MENLTNEELLEEFDLLEKEIEDETTVTDRRLVILERQKELFAQLRINVRRRPTTQVITHWQKRPAAPGSVPPHDPEQYFRDKAEAGMLDASEEASYREKFEGR